MNEDEHDQAVMDLAVRTLLAYATRDGERLEGVLDEWERFTIHDLLGALLFISMNMRRIMGLDQQEGTAELHVVGIDIDDPDVPLGVRTGARLYTASLNGDVVAARDVIQHFIDNVADEEIMGHALAMFRCVFSLAAQGCVAAFELDQRKQAETN